MLLTQSGLIPQDGGDPVTPEDVAATDQAIQVPRWQASARRAREQLDQLGVKNVEPERPAA